MRPARPHERLIVAVDVDSLDAARALCRSLKGRVGLAKVGLELFVAEGAASVRTCREEGLEVFLDLKLHDIPNTVEHAAKAAGRLGVRMLTVHASGGARMVQAARRGLDAAGARDTLLLAVTVLTSQSEAELLAQGVGSPLESQVSRLARLALESGADGLVCSPLEVRRLREEFGPTPALVVPGIRPQSSGPDDQSRTATAREALEAGADWLVVGRPLRLAADPALAAEALASELF